MDKVCIEAIRSCIMSDQTDKVFGYLDMIEFSQSLKICIKMVEQMKRPDLAQKLNKFINDKQTKDVFLQQMPSDQKPLSQMPTNTLTKRVMPPAAPLGFSDQFKSDRSSTIGGISSNLINKP